MSASTAQPRQTRCINSSSHGAQAPLSLRPVLPQVREAVAKQVEELLGTEWRISHRFNEAKDGRNFKYDTMYAWKREGRERPGLLILGAGDQPAIFWDMDRDEPCALRFQVPFGFLRQGYAAFPATLLRGERRLILEDIWVRDGRKLDTLPFSARWRQLVACYEQFTARVGPSAGAQARQADATAHIKLPPTVTKNVLKKTTALLTARHAMVRTDKTTTLPDSYVLESAEGTLIGRACVTKLSQSQELRAKFAAQPDGFPVEVAWHSDFKKYEIVKALPEGTPLTSASSFFEVDN